MPAERTLTELLAELRANASEQSRTLYDAMVKDLVTAGAALNALKEGDKFPEFMLASAEGAFVRSETLLARGPLVISFYRGRWCPYCAAELDALSRAAPAIRAAGATLVGVTPEAGGDALATKLERKLDFDILVDLDNGLALDCGLVFRLPRDVQQAYVGVGRDLSHIYGNDSWFLPIPATYIVARDGVVAKAYVNPDFRHRLDPAEILSALKAMKP